MEIIGEKQGILDFKLEYDKNNFKIKLDNGKKTTELTLSIDDFELLKLYEKVYSDLLPFK